MSETADAIIVSTTKRFVPKLFLAFAVNPALDGSAPSRETPPLVFERPEGCEVVEFSFGPMQPNPGFGLDEDLALPVKIDTPRWTLDGNQVRLRVPWRSAPSVTLPAGRLRMPVYARFSRR